MSHVTKSASIALVLSTFAVACGIESSVVGGECATGYELSGGRCVPQSTPVTPAPPATTPAPAPTALVGPVPTPPSQAVPPSFVEPTITPPELELPPVIVEPVTPPILCAPGSTECGGVCIPTSADPDNCGACGKICRSNICINGECQGSTPGDVVVMGLDYAAASASSMETKALVNALTIPTTNPIRVLSYEEGADPTAVANTKALAASQIKGRKVTFKVATPTSLESSSLSTYYDVVIVHGVPSTNPTALGARWKTPLGTFAMKGGLVLAIDDASTPMPAMLQSAGLITTTGHTQLATMAHLLVSAPGDVMGTQILSPFAPFGAPVSFQGTTEGAGLTWVVRERVGSSGMGDPVILHRVVQ